jgi:hypothetical protein
MAPLSPTGKVSKHTKETQSLTDCLRYFLRASAAGGRPPRHYAPWHRLSCVQEANPHVLDDEFIYRFIYNTDCIFGDLLPKPLCDEIPGFLTRI